MKEGKRLFVRERMVVFVGASGCRRMGKCVKELIVFERCNARVSICHMYF